MTEISRKTQLVAQALFGMGAKSSVVFKTPSRISAECQAGIDELVAARMIEPLPKGDIPRGAVGWKGTDKIGFPMLDYMRPSLDEIFYLTKGENNDERHA